MELARRLEDTELDAVYSSDLQRARHGRDRGPEQRPHCRDDARLPRGRRRLVVGLTRAEAEARYPELYVRWLQGAEGWEDGETYEQLGERVIPAIQRIATNHRGERVLVVAHGGPSERSMQPRSVSTSTRIAGSSASSRTRRSRQSASTKVD